MPNYINGKIYKIINPQNEIIYIGSTAQKQLCDRFKNHEHRGNGNKIILVENCPCNSKQELIKREQELIEQFDNLLNIRNAYISEEYLKKYHKEYHKEHYENNKDKILEQVKEYREENKEIISEKHKKYREKNKEKLSEKKKIYYEEHKNILLEKMKVYNEENKDKILEIKKKHYEKNKDKILEKKKIKINCECGCQINKCDISRHKKTKKHIKLMENIII